jgi:hypothetical protein
VARPVNLTGTPNLIDAERAARSLGVTVLKVYRTGEIRFMHPSFTRSVKVNERRKDAPRALLVALRKVAALAAGEE